LLDQKITALTPDLALGTQVVIWENWWKNGDYRKVKGATTNLWKKGPDGWKIIYVHESRLAILEEKLVSQSLKNMV
jgi:ketosteroid isomerase-like protein